MASYSVTSLIFNGQTMPVPKLEGITITREKVWSADTGRVSTGKMQGTLIAIKTKIEVEWPPLTLDQVAIIESAVSDMDHPFTDITFTDMAGERKTITAYFGTPTYTQYSFIDGIQYIMDVAVDGIEQ